MTKPREQLVSLEETPYYHCVCRCVRRAFLCGKDSGRSFEHRRGWILDRIKQISSVFTVDIAAYAIMSNHYHIVIHIDKARADKLTDAEVIERWLQLFNAPPLLQRHLQQPLTNSVELDAVRDIIEKWRARLCSISWYMRALNEYIARKANEEDHSSGHFWEARFKSQALIDETALFTCMAYVDLNPIRANMTQTLKESDYTSIQERLGITLQQEKDQSIANGQSTLEELMPFSGSVINDTLNNHLSFTFSDYLELIDWAGRAVRYDKSGYIPDDTPKILMQFNLTPEQWLSTCTHVERKFHLVIGPVAKVDAFTEKIKQSWLKGRSACRELYGAG